MGALEDYEALPRELDRRTVGEIDVAKATKIVCAVCNRGVGRVVRSSAGYWIVETGKLATRGSAPHWGITIRPLPSFDVDGPDPADWSDEPWAQCGSCLLTFRPRWPVLIDFWHRRKTLRLYPQ